MGSIVLTRFPFTELSGDKRRTALAVSRDNDRRSDLIVRFITSMPPAVRIRRRWPRPPVLVSKSHPLSGRFREFEDCGKQTGCGRPGRRPSNECGEGARVQRHHRSDGNVHSLDVEPPIGCPTDIHGGAVGAGHGGPVGDTLAVRLPGEIVDAIKLRDRERVEIEGHGGEAVILRASTIGGPIWAAKSFPNDLRLHTFRW